MAGMKQTRRTATASRAQKSGAPGRTFQPGEPRPDSNSPFSSIPEALAELRAGRFIILVDDEDRENEGDLVIAAEKVTPAAINFMAKQARGLICLALTEQRCDELLLPLASQRQHQPLRHRLHGFD